MRRLLKHTAAAIVLAVAATMLITTPASADRLVTTTDATAPLFDCPTNDVNDGCFRHGNAPSGTNARSYCARDNFDLIFSEGAANRFGFIHFEALANQSQPTDCFNGGIRTSVKGDAPLRACANQNCGEISDLAVGDVLRAYCVRRDSANTAWVGLFNTNGQRTGFTRFADTNLSPFAFIDGC